MITHEDLNKLAWDVSQKITYLGDQDEEYQFRACKAAIYNGLKECTWGHEDASFDTTLEDHYNFIQSETLLHTNYPTTEHALLEYIKHVNSPECLNSLEMRDIDTRNHRYDIVLQAVAIEFFGFLFECSLQSQFMSQKFGE